MKKLSILFFSMITVGSLILLAQKPSLPSVLNIHNLFSDDLGVRERLFFSIFERPGGLFSDVSWGRGNTKIIFTYRFQYEDPNEIPPLREPTLSMPTARA